MWPRRMRAALVIGVLWGAAWALIGGGIMEGVIDPGGEVVDMWPQVLGVVGFSGGVLFGALMWAAGRRRRFGEFSFREFAALGAVAGVLQGAIAMALVGAPLLFVGVTTLATTAAATGSLAVARMAGSRAELPR